MALKNFSAPLLVVRATHDEIIPAASTQALFDSFTGPKQIFNISSGHNSWGENIPGNWWPALCKQMQELR